MKEDNTPYLFTYGTLLNSASNTMADLLRRNSRYIGRGCLPGVLYNIGSYPGLIHKPDGKEKVYGDVVKLLNRDVILENLDEYEGATSRFDFLFKRSMITVYCGDQAYPCWTYLYNRPVGDRRRISSGDYSAWSKRAGKINQPSKDT